MQYVIKWYGYNVANDSFEPEADIPTHFIKRYWGEIGRRKQITKIEKYHINATNHKNEKGIRRHGANKMIYENLIKRIYLLDGRCGASSMDSTALSQRRAPATGVPTITASTQRNAATELSLELKLGRLRAQSNPWAITR